MGKPAARATIPDFFVAGLEGAPARAFARQGLRLNRDINYSSCRKSCAGIAKRCACSQQAQPFFWNSLPSREARATLWNEAQQKLASGVRAEAILGVARAPLNPPLPQLILLRAHSRQNKRFRVSKQRLSSQQQQSQSFLFREFRPRDGYSAPGAESQKGNHGETQQKTDNWGRLPSQGGSKLFGASLRSREARWLPARLLECQKSCAC